MAKATPPILNALNRPGFKPGWSASILCILSTAALLAACDEPSPEFRPVDTLPAVGHIDIAVGQDTRTFDLSGADCTVDTEDGHQKLFVRAYSTTKLKKASGETFRPHLLAAELPPDLSDEVRFTAADDAPWRATASVLDAEYEGTQHEMIQLIAADVLGASPDYACRASKDGPTVEVVCNEATVFPWTAPGDVPPGAFRAKIECDAEQ